MTIRVVMIIFTLFIISKAVFISKVIPRNSEFCLTEDIPRHTLVKIEIKTNALVKFQFKQGMVPLMNYQIDNTSLTRSITTQRYGTHYFCFLNKGQYNTKVRMQISIGRRANDYGSIVQSQDFLGSLKNQANIAQDFIQQIVRENTEGLQIMLAEQRDHYSFTQLYLFSGLFALLSMILTFLQYKVIKRYLHARKYI